MSEKNDKELNTPNPELNVALAGKEMKKKSLMLIISLVLLVAAAVFFAYAWFTKMTAVSGVEFDVAQWEFNANYQGDGIFAKVYRYDSSSQDKAAPGTDGYVPLHLSATQSDVDVNYFISVDKSSLVPEMQKRLIFYYRNGDTKEEYRDNSTSLNTLIEFSNIDDRILAGTVKHGTEGKDVFFYWRWVYDLREALQCGCVPGAPQNMVNDAKNKGISDATFYSSYKDQCDEWDEYDTKIGINPEAYEKNFIVKTVITGVQFESSDVYKVKPDDDVVKPLIPGYND